jgi:N utilization substance protein B
MSDAAPHAAARRPGTHHPRLARERALKVLFQADVRGLDARELLDRLETSPAALELLDELEPDEEQVAGDSDLRDELARRERLPLDDYTRILVDGVESRRHAIDRLLGDVAERWAVGRMPALDRNLLRLAVYELVVQDTPHAVVIDEALALAGGFAGERTGPFVNGVLETIRQRLVDGDVDLGDARPLRDPRPAAAPADAPADGPGSTVVDAATAAFDARAGVGDAADAALEGDDVDAEPEPVADPGNEAAWDDAIGLLDELDATEDAADDDLADPDEADDDAFDDVELSAEREVAELLGELDENGEPLAGVDDDEVDPMLGDLSDDLSDELSDGLSDGLDAGWDDLAD